MWFRDFDTWIFRYPIPKMDATSFRIIYDLYFEPICEFLAYYTRDTAAIEDVVQDVFVSLWENKEYLEIQYMKTYPKHCSSEYTTLPFS